MGSTSPGYCWNTSIGERHGCYLYELVDEGTPSSNRENSFGLVRNNGTPKPAFTAFKNLLALLADPGPGFVPGRLSLSGDLTAVHTTLLQKRNGTFYLAL